MVRLCLQSLHECIWSTHSGACAVLEQVFELVQLMILTRVERGDFMYALDGANELGLVLQKLNIISDYHEDINEVPAPRYVSVAPCLLPGAWC